MTRQRAHRPSPPLAVGSATSRTSPRPFATEPREDAETTAFEQRKREAAGLEVRGKSGAITPEEGERLSALHQEMQGFWTGKVERASRFGHNFADIPVQRPAPSAAAPVQTMPANAPGGQPQSPPARENRTGMPDRLKAGIEKLSGMPLNDVKVHYNSAKPAQLQAKAYTQGTEIHVGPGEEKHLAHEAWHVVQQKQGRVRPTMRMKGKGINDDSSLEKEADVMGEKAAQQPAT